MTEVVFFVCQILSGALGKICSNRIKKKNIPFTRAQESHSSVAVNTMTKSNLVTYIS